MESTGSPKSSRRELITGAVLLFIAAGVLIARPITPRAGYADVPDVALLVEPESPAAHEDGEEDDSAQ